MAKRVGIVLSGCGARDGSEIREAMFTLLAVERAGGKAVFAAPDTMQPRAFQVIIPAGSTTHTFDVPIVDDVDIELDETVVMTIRSARLAAAIGVNASHVLTIQSDE